MHYRKNPLSKASFGFRLLSSFLRKEPDYLIIGVQKGGTSYLQFLLSQHPQIQPSFEKEIHYFDLNYSKGNNWYRSYFPFKWTKKLSGEATPSYFYFSECPARIAKLKKKPKLILLLRDPVSRAISHYEMSKRRGFEKLDLADALSEEGNRIAAYQSMGLEGKKLEARHSYTQRGFYTAQMKNWLRFFSIENFHILSSADLFMNTQSELDKLFSFLNLNPFIIKDLKGKNIGSYGDVDENTIKMLTEIFHGEKESFAKIVSKRIDW